MFSLSTSSLFCHPCPAEHLESLVDDTFFSKLFKMVQVTQGENKNPVLPSSPLFLCLHLLHFACSSSALPSTFSILSLLLPKGLGLFQFLFWKVFSRVLIHLLPSPSPLPGLCSNRIWKASSCPGMTCWFLFHFLLCLELWAFDHCRLLYQGFLALDFSWGSEIDTAYEEIGGRVEVVVPYSPQQGCSLISAGILLADVLNCDFSDIVHLSPRIINVMHATC